MNRRDILRRSAAAGLLATPAAGLLAGCATGGGDDKGDTGTYKGTKSEQNPLGVKEDAPLEVVIFNGGFGEEYAKAHEAMYKEKYPKAKIKHSATQEISKTLQPRFVDGTPPDVVNNSGAGQIDFNGLVSQNAARRPRRAARRAEPRHPGQDGARHPAARRGRGRLVRRQVPGAELHLHRLRHLVLQQALHRAQGLGSTPKTWDEHIALCKTDQGRRHRALDVRRACTRAT